MFGPLDLGPCPETGDDWSELYDFYAGLVLKFVTNKGYHHQLAQDVLQETMLCLWKELQKYHQNSNQPINQRQINAKIFTIARSRLIDLRRKNFRYVELKSTKQNQLFTEDKVNWDQDFEEKIKDEIIFNLKKNLNKLKYSVFKLIILESRKIRDVADALNLEPRQISDIKYQLTQLIEKESKRVRRQYDTW